MQILRQAKIKRKVGSTKKRIKNCGINIIASKLASEQLLTIRVTPALLPHQDQEIVCYHARFGNTFYAPGNSRISFRTIKLDIAQTEDTFFLAKTQL